METLLNFLNTIWPLSESLKEYLFLHINLKEIPKKEYLLKAGQISRNVCFIQKGLLRCFYLKDGKEVSSWFMKEGDVIFSISSFYEQKAGFEYIQALEDCALFYITYDELEYIYRTFMEFNYVGRKLTIKYHQLWDEQLYSIRMQSAEERYDWLMTNHPELIQRVPAKHLASWLDITEVTLSQMKAKKKLNFFNSGDKKVS